MDLLKIKCIFLSCKLYRFYNKKKKKFICADCIWLSALEILSLADGKSVILRARHEIKIHFP